MGYSVRRTRSVRGEGVQFIMINNYVYLTRVGGWSLKIKISYIITFMINGLMINILEIK